MDTTTTPVGEWAPIYAERLHVIEGVVPPVDWSDSTSDRGARMAAWGMTPFGEPEATDKVCEERDIPGPHGPVRVRIYRPVTGELSGAGLMWLHGGAFIMGDLDMPEADQTSRGLVSRTRGVVVSVDYRLCVDGVHHPVPHDDCWAAYEWTRDNAAELGIDPARLAVGGASAGGNLAAGVALHGLDVGELPWQALLAYPVLHPWLPEPSPQFAACLAKMPAVLPFRDGSEALNENYLGGPIATHAAPYAFPGVAADFTGYPSTYIENCEFDDLRASGEEFGRQLAAVGVDVTVVTAAGVPHGHLNAVGSPLTAATLDRFAARLAQ